MPYCWVLQFRISGLERETKNRKRIQIDFRQRPEGEVAADHSQPCTCHIGRLFVQCDEHADFGLVLHFTLRIPGILGKKGREGAKKGRGGACKNAPILVKRPEQLDNNK